jgi:hypothetical protein
MSESSDYQLSNVEIFATGVERQKNYTDADLRDVVRNFDLFSSPDAPKVYLHVPVVIGHDEEQEGHLEEYLKRTDLPAAGWVCALRTKPGKLLADFDYVAPEMAELFRTKKFRMFSAEVYDAVPAGLPGGYGKMLRRVAALGAEIPQVKGLAEAPMPERMSEGAVRLVVPVRYVGRMRLPGGVWAAFSEVACMAERRVPQAGERVNVGVNARPGRIVGPPEVQEEEHGSSLISGLGGRPDAVRGSRNDRIKDDSGQRYGDYAEQPLRVGYQAVVHNPESVHHGRQGEVVGLSQGHIQLDMPATNDRGPMTTWIGRRFVRRVKAAPMAEGDGGPGEGASSNEARHRQRNRARWQEDGPYPIHEEGNRQRTDAEDDSMLQQQGRVRNPPLPGQWRQGPGEDEQYAEQPYVPQVGHRVTLHAPGMPYHGRGGTVRQAGQENSFVHFHGDSSSGAREHEAVIPNESLRRAAVPNAEDEPPKKQPPKDKADRRLRSPRPDTRATSINEQSQTTDAEQDFESMQGIHPGHWRGHVEGKKPQRKQPPATPEERRQRSPRLRPAPGENRTRTDAENDGVLDLLRPVADHPGHWRDGPPYEGYAEVPLSEEARGLLQEILDNPEAAGELTPLLVELFQHEGQHEAAEALEDAPPETVVAIAKRLLGEQMAECPGPDGKKRPKRRPRKHGEDEMAERHPDVGQTVSDEEGDAVIERRGHLGGEPASLVRRPQTGMGDVLQDRQVRDEKGKRFGQYAEDDPDPRDDRRKRHPSPSGPFWAREFDEACVPKESVMAEDRRPRAGDRVTIDLPGHQHHGRSGTIFASGPFEETHGHAFISLDADPKRDPTGVRRGGRAIVPEDRLIYHGPPNSEMAEGKTPSSSDEFESRLSAASAAPEQHPEAIPYQTKPLHPEIEGLLGDVIDNQHDHEAVGDLRRVLHDAMLDHGRTDLAQHLRSTGRRGTVAMAHHLLGVGEMGEDDEPPKKQPPATPEERRRRSQQPSPTWEEAPRPLTDAEQDWGDVTDPAAHPGHWRHHAEDEPEGEPTPPQRLQRGARVVTQQGDKGRITRTRPGHVQMRPEGSVRGRQRIDQPETLVDEKNRQGFEFAEEEPTNNVRRPAPGAGLGGYLIPQRLPSEMAGGHRSSLPEREVPGGGVLDLHDAPPLPPAKPRPSYAASAQIPWNHLIDERTPRGQQQIAAFQHGLDELHGDDETQAILDEMEWGHRPHRQINVAPGQEMAEVPLKVGDRAVYHRPGHGWHGRGGTIERIVPREDGDYAHFRFEQDPEQGPAGEAGEEPPRLFRTDSLRRAPVSKHTERPFANVSADKARRMLHDGTAQGHALTEKQRGALGARASGYAEGDPTAEDPGAGRIRRRLRLGDYVQTPSGDTGIVTGRGGTESRVDKDNGTQDWHQRNKLRDPKTGAYYEDNAEEGHVEETPEQRRAEPRNRIPRAPRRGDVVQTSDDEIGEVTAEPGAVFRRSPPAVRIDGTDQFRVRRGSSLRDPKTGAYYQDHAEGDVEEVPPPHVGERVRTHFPDDPGGWHGLAGTVRDVVTGQGIDPRVAVGFDKEHRGRLGATFLYQQLRPANNYDRDVRGLAGDLASTHDDHHAAKDLAGVLHDALLDAGHDHEANLVSSADHDTLMSIARRMAWQHPEQRPKEDKP